METAAQVGWLLHTQKAFLFTWLVVASLQRICILPFLWVCIIICICGQNHLQGQTLLSGIQVQLLWKGTRFGSASTGAKSRLCQPFIWRYRKLRLQLEQLIDERASEKSLLAQVFPLLFSVNSATPRRILQQFPPYCIFTLLVPHSKEKICSNVIFPPGWKRVQALSQGFEKEAVVLCISILGVSNTKHIQPILFSCSRSADLVAANGYLSDFRLKLKLKVTQTAWRMLCNISACCSWKINHVVYELSYSS